MKKILSLFFVFLLSYLFSISALAQSPVIVKVATVSVLNAKIISQNNRDFSISFDIANKIGVQPSVKYSIYLTNASISNTINYDEKVFDDQLTLGENQVINRNVKYSIPDSIKAGIYRILIFVKNSSGMTLSVASLGDVKISDNVKNTIEIVPNSCYLQVNGVKNAIGAWITIEKGAKIIANCKVKNTFDVDTQLIPNFITRSDSSFGDLASTTDIQKKSLIIKSGDSDVSVELPQAIKSGAYNIEFSLVSSDNRIISNSVDLNYLIAGQIGKIQNIVLDKSLYKSGDIANLTIYTTQIGVGGISVVITGIENGIEVDCSSSTSRQVSGSSIINLSVPIIRDCNSPKTNTILSTDGKILDSNNVYITPSQNKQTPSANSINTIIIATVLILTGLILSFYFYRKKIFIIIILIFIFSFNNVFAGGPPNCSVYGYGYTYCNGTQSQYVNYRSPEPCNGYAINQVISTYGCTPCCKSYSYSPATCPISGQQTVYKNYLPSGCKMPGPDAGMCSQGPGVIAYDPGYYSGQVINCYPDSPSGLVASCPVPGTSVTLSWNPVSNASKYSVTVGTAPAFIQTPTTVTIPNMTPAVTYNWSVASINNTNMYSSAPQGSFTCIPPTATTSINFVSSIVPTGNSTLLNLSAIGVTSCTLTGNNLGTIVITPDSSNNISTNYSSGILTNPGPASTTVPFSFSCTGLDGSHPSSNKSITVLPPVIPINNFSFYTNSPTIITGNSVTLTWNAPNAQTCTINGNSVATSGSMSTGILTATTTYTETCSNPSPYSTTSVVVVGVQPIPKPNPKLKFSYPEVSWDCGLYTDTAILTQTYPLPMKVYSTNTSGNIVDWSLPQNATFDLSCSNVSGNVTLGGIVNQASAQPSICSISLQNYVNRNTVWSIVNASGTPISTIWSGTDILTPITKSGGQFTKIYTTVGKKTIQAASTMQYNGTTTTFTTYCSTTTTIKVDEGTIQEI